MIIINPVTRTPNGRPKNLAVKAFLLKLRCTGFAVSRAHRYRLGVAPFPVPSCPALPTGISCTY